MIARAVGRHIRISPRKARAVIFLIKDRYVDDALAILGNVNKKAASFLIKLLNSAVANAKRIPNIRREDLYISNIFADGGPSLKRYKAQALGRATMIRRRTSHITVELDARQQQPLKPAKKVKRPGQKKDTTQSPAAPRPKAKKAGSPKTVQK